MSYSWQVTSNSVDRPDDFERRNPGARRLRHTMFGVGGGLWIQSRLLRLIEIDFDARLKGGVVDVEHAAQGCLVAACKIPRHRNTLPLAVFEYRSIALR